VVFPSQKNFNVVYYKISI